MPGLLPAEFVWPLLAVTEAAGFCTGRQMLVQECLPSHAVELREHAQQVHNLYHILRSVPDRNIDSYMLDFLNHLSKTFPTWRKWGILEVG